MASEHDNRAQGPIRLTEHARGIWTSEPFALVLALVFFTFVFVVAIPDREWAAVVIVALQGATLIVCLGASGARPRLLRSTALIVGLATLFSLVAVMGVADRLSDAFVRIVAILLVSVAPVALARSILHSLIRRRRVTLQVIFGVVSIYMLLGLVFAYVYSAVGAIDSGTFFAQGESEQLRDFVYFSYVTLTTTGYGDLTAAGGLGRAIAIVEALSGQLYLIIILSLFVSNLRPRRQEEA